MARLKTSKAKHVLKTGFAENGAAAKTESKQEHAPTPTTAGLKTTNPQSLRPAKKKQIHAGMDIAIFLKKIGIPVGRIVNQILIPVILKHQEILQKRVLEAQLSQIVVQLRHNTPNMTHIIPVITLAAARMTSHFVVKNVKKQDMINQLLSAIHLI